jgi:hypothetical protein
MPQEQNIRELPAPEGGRVETGPVQFGKDWPGTFIRGDDSAYYAMLLNQLLETGEVDLISKIQLRGLVEELHGSNIGPSRERVSSLILQLRNANKAGNDAETET